MVTICITVLLSNKTKELQSLTTLARLMENGKKPDLFIVASFLKLCKGPVVTKESVPSFTIASLSYIVKKYTNFLVYAKSTTLRFQIN